jgi:hypothetical protein
MNPSLCIAQFRIPNPHTQMRIKAIFAKQDPPNKQSLFFENSLTLNLTNILHNIVSQLSETKQPTSFKK